MSGQIYSGQNRTKRLLRRLGEKPKRLKRYVQNAINEVFFQKYDDELQLQLDEEGRNLDEYSNMELAEHLNAKAAEEELEIGDFWGDTMFEYRPTKEEETLREISERLARYRNSLPQWNQLSATDQQRLSRHEMGLDTAFDRAVEVVEVERDHTRAHEIIDEFLQREKFEVLHVGNAIQV